MEQTIDAKENHILLARFMGAKKTGSATAIEPNGRANEYKAVIAINITAIFYDKEGAWTDTRGMYFDTSWDWFMPVWFKFRDLKEFKGWEKFEQRQFKKRIVNAICFNNNPSYAFNELVEAIKWYNSQKIKPE